MSPLVGADDCAHRVRFSPAHPDEVRCCSSSPGRVAGYARRVPAGRVPAGIGPRFGSYDLFGVPVFWVLCRSPSR